MTTAFPQVDYSWEFLKKFHYEGTQDLHDWQSLRLLIEKSEQAIKPHILECKNLEHLWEKRLSSLCGNQTNINWSKFRPLRLNREEDWSDWLAWLLETSQEGFLADSLFGEHMKCQIAAFISPNVKREDRLESRRADIVIRWKTKRMTQVEVKLWDENFDKTFETANELQEKEPDTDWTHFILIPSQLRDEWKEAAHRNTKREAVEVMVILWNDVARGLRRCLWRGSESIFWRAWAWAFCRAIETELLGLEKLECEFSQPQIEKVLLRLKILRVDPEEEI